jgi:ssDNA-binding Zn-finger/Zn-ribbon topoisomerase 1
MAQCPKCKRVWNTLPGEEQDHDCPRCGPPTDRLIDEVREAKAFPCSAP